MKEINNFIESADINDCRVELIAILSKVITALSTDNKEEIKTLIPKLIMDLSIYNQVLNKPIEKNIEEKEASPPPESDYLADILNGTLKIKEITEEPLIIEEVFKKEPDKVYISEIFSYKIKVYNKEQTIPEEDYDREGRIIIPSTDENEYWLKVLISDNENILFCEKNEFEKEFPYIKAAYIREFADEESNEEKTKINERLDALVDLELLFTDTKIATYKNFKIEYAARPKSEQQKRLEGRRQSFIDNYKIRFIYNEKTRIYHDKACNEVKLIPLEDLGGSEKVPAGYTACNMCLMDMLIRKGCKDDFKNAGIYRYFFSKGGINTELLKRFFENYNTSFRAESISMMKFVSKEDSWKIETDGKGNLLNLYHNSYSTDNKGERHFDGTYHIQKSAMVMDVRMALEYIIDYDFKNSHSAM